MGRTGADLNNNPQNLPLDNEDSPGKYDKGYDALTVIGGHLLELMTRMNQPMAEATDMAFILVERFGSTYVGHRMDSIMRKSVSKDGGGRRDIIDLTKACSKEDDEGIKAKLSYSPAIEDDD